MSTVQGIHDPVELARYGLPEGVWAWLIEPDAADLAAKGVDAQLYSVTVVGIDSWSADPDVAGSVDDPDARIVRIPGLVPMDIRYLSVKLISTSAELTWVAPVGLPARLDLLNVGDLKQAQVVELFRARRLIDLQWGPAVGRPPGATDLSTDEFELKLRAVLREQRRLVIRPRQDVVAEDIGINVTTLRKYLRLIGVKWGSIRRGEWPDRVSSVSSLRPLHRMARPSGRKE